MQRIAVVPGSFDPVTRGHLDVIERAAGLYDQLHVVVVHNPDKSALLPIAQRVALIEQSIADAHIPGDIVVAENGERASGYSEAEASAYMKRQELALRVGIGLGQGRATVYTCDLTHGYISINGDYRS